MFGKVQAWAPDREGARKRLVCALGALEVQGVATTAPYLAGVLDHTDFATVSHDTGSIERIWQPDEASRPQSSLVAPTSQVRTVRLSTSQGAIEIDIHGSRRERPKVLASPTSTARTACQSRPAAGEPVAPIDGAVIRIAVNVGDMVQAGDLLAVMEAMKMELAVRASRAGRVEAILVEMGQVASRGSLLVQLGKADYVQA
jgi:acetyl-CoA/propionyl-CoA carboxylase biotin carboxyl carrier protein